jgi:hypothetical protein
MIQKKADTVIRIPLIFSKFQPKSAQLHFAQKLTKLLAQNVRFLGESQPFHLLGPLLGGKYYQFLGIIHHYEFPLEFGSNFVEYKKRLSYLFLITFVILSLIFHFKCIFRRILSRSIKFKVWLSTRPF